MATYTLKVADIKRDTIIADGTEFLDVTAEIYDGKKLVYTKKQGFPIDTPEKEIRETLNRMLGLFIEEKAQAVVEAERVEANAASEKTITNVSNLEIEHEELPSKSARKGRGRG